jgi:hypothetical protein
MASPTNYADTFGKSLRTSMYSGNNKNSQSTLQAAVEKDRYTNQVSDSLTAIVPYLQDALGQDKYGNFIIDPEKLNPEIFENGTLQRVLSSIDISSYDINSKQLNKQPVQNVVPNPERPGFWNILGIGGANNNEVVPLTNEASNSPTDVVTDVSTQDVGKLLTNIVRTNMAYLDREGRALPTSFKTAMQSPVLLRSILGATTTTDKSIATATASGGLLNFIKDKAKENSVKELEALNPEDSDYGAAKDIVNKKAAVLERNIYSIDPKEARSIALQYFNGDEARLDKALAAYNKKESVVEVVEEPVVEEMSARDQLFPSLEKAQAVTKKLAFRNRSRFDQMMGDANYGPGGLNEKYYTGGDRGIKERDKYYSSPPMQDSISTFVGTLFDPEQKTFAQTRKAQVVSSVVDEMTQTRPDLKDLIEQAATQYVQEKGTATIPKAEAFISEYLMEQGAAPASEENFGFSSPGERNEAEERAANSSTNIGALLKAIPVTTGASPDELAVVQEGVKDILTQNGVTEVTELRKIPDEYELTRAIHGIAFASANGDMSSAQYKDTVNGLMNIVSGRPITETGETRLETRKLNTDTALRSKKVLGEFSDILTATGGLVNNFSLDDKTEENKLKVATSVSAMVDAATELTGDLLSGTIAQTPTNVRNVAKKQKQAAVEVARYLVATEPEGLFESILEYFQSDRATTSLEGFDSIQVQGLDSEGNITGTSKLVFSNTNKGISFNEATRGGANADLVGYLFMQVARQNRAIAQRNGSQ